MAMEIADTSGAPLGLEMPDLQQIRAANLGRETYATFLLLAIAGFTLAGYVGLALFFLGALR